MKKTIGIILATVLAASLALAACGQKKEESQPVPQTSAPETTPPVPETKEAPAAPETQEATDSSISAEEIRTLLDRAATLQTIDACGLGIDTSVEYTDESGHVYNLVTAEEFQSIGDIWEYLFDTFTAEAAEQYFPWLVNMGEADVPTYLYLQDVEHPGLYELQGGKGFTSYSPQGDIEIVESDETSFTAVTTIDDFGMEKELTVKGVLEDGTWKLSSLEYEK